MILKPTAAAATRRGGRPPARSSRSGCGLEIAQHDTSVADLHRSVAYLHCVEIWLIYCSRASLKKVYKAARARTKHPEFVSHRV
jgi:hypothetical protein